MKTLITSTLFLLSCTNLQEKNKDSQRTEIVFLNSDDDYPMPVSEQQFWEFKENLDTIVILGSRQNNILNEKLKQLSTTNVTLKNYDFYHRVALIRYEDRNLRDTIYTDPLFNYWKIDNKVFEDTSGYFKSRFFSFLLL